MYIYTSNWINENTHVTDLFEFIAKLEAHRYKILEIRINCDVCNETKVVYELRKIKFPPNTVRIYIIQPLLILSRL